MKLCDSAKAHIVGYSYGGYTALHLAVNHPEMVRTLVLAEPPLVPWLTNLFKNPDEGKRLLLRQKTHFTDHARKALVKQNGKTQTSRTKNRQTGIRNTDESGARRRRLSKPRPRSLCLLPLGTNEGSKRSLPQGNKRKQTKSKTNEVCLRFGGLGNANDRHEQTKSGTNEVCLRTNKRSLPSFWRFGECT